MRADVLILCAETHMHVPAALPLLRRLGGDEITAVRELPHNEHGARKPNALAVDFRPDVLAQRGPPQITLGDERRLVF